MSAYTSAHIKYVRMLNGANETRQTTTEKCDGIYRIDRKQVSFKGPVPVWVYFAVGTSTGYPALIHAPVPPETFSRFVKP